jgi:outer membrane lipoprotein carrier protein
MKRSLVTALVSFTLVGPNVGLSEAKDPNHAESTAAEVDSSSAVQILRSAQDDAGRAAVGQRDDDVWPRIELLRRALAEGGPLAARFTQTYVPKGFSSGESESGTLFLALPDCLRWDYDEPYPKSFLLCGQDVYAWNRGESVGRRSRVDARQEAGLDLLLLSVDELRSRYAATPGAAGGEISLVPLRAPASAPAQASLALDATGKRLVGLSYRDREGNLTRFALSEYRPRAAAEKDIFQPPAGISWQDQ